MKMLQMLILSVIVLIQLCMSCKTSEKMVKNNQLTACDSTKMELKYTENSVEDAWLMSNESKCSRINEFLKIYSYSEDSKAYIRKFLQMKMQDNEYKLERFIELYCLMNQNPNALIDGTLEKN